MSCSICLSDIECDRKLYCGHYFHDQCIEKWLEKNNTCPNCRQLTHPLVEFEKDCTAELITRDFMSQLLLVMMVTIEPSKIIVKSNGSISVRFENF